MTGILYFSSTGNSLQIAKRVQERFGGNIVFIPSYEGSGSEFDRIFIVTPIYSFGLPTPVFDLLPRLDKQKEIFVIQNYGGMVGGADALFLSYAKKHGLNIKSIHTIKMPENYTLTFTVPKFYIRSTLRKSTKRIDCILDKIENKKFNLPKKKKTKEKTYLKNKSNWHIIGTRFKANEKCVKCQKCVKICPAKNISLKDGEIVFGDKCIACLGCYHRCPNHAIVYNGKDKKTRYINPNVNENEMGKNIDQEKK